MHVRGKLQSQQTAQKLAKADTITEYTPTTGVTVGGVLLKDSGINGEVNTTVIQATPSDVLRASDDSAGGNSVIDYEKIKEITIPANYISGSSFRVKFDIYGSVALPTYGRIYKNGVAFGTEHSTTAESWDTKSEDLAFEGGDKCELWVKREWTGYAQNFRIYCDNTAVLVGVDPTWS